MSDFGHNEKYPQASAYMSPDIDPEFDRDPYTPLRRLADTTPVASGRNGEFRGVKVPNFIGFPDHDQDVFLTLTYDAWREVNSNSKAFSSEKAQSTALLRTFGRVLAAMDPPEHTLYKKMVLPSFSHRMVNEELVGIVEPIISKQLDSIVDQGRADLAASFAMHYPFLVVGKLFGVPPEMMAASTDLANQGTLLATNPDPEIVQNTFQEMDDFYKEVVAYHREHPQDDITSSLIDTEVDGRKLTDAEVVAFLKMIVGAGLDSTSRQTATLIWLLLQNPEQFDDLKANPDLIDAAIWECLRIETAVPVAPRVANYDTEVCGVKIPAGSGVYALIGMANRDPARWEKPGEFNIRRERKAIATFGTGIHACLGQSLALAEMKIAMTAILSRLKNLRKDPAHWDDAYLRGWSLRSPTIVPVLWDKN